MRLSSFLYALALTNWYCSVCFLLQRRFTQEFQPNHCPMMQKVLFPLTSVAQERCSSSSLLNNEQDNRDTAPLSVVKFCNSLIHSLTIANCCKLLPSPVNDIPLCQLLPTLALFITCSKCRWKSANGNLGRFPFNKNSSSKFRKFHLPNGTVHSLSLIHIWRCRRRG